MLARAMTRKGNALQKKGDLEAAVAAYSKARSSRGARTSARPRV
jgi:predicted negative regulator of RcsB-dependent stress response